jgi:hypothetical protein
MNVQSIVPSSTIAAPLDFSANLSPDALMVYLSSRLNGLDGQINAIFNTEKTQTDAQAALRELKEAVGQLTADSGATTQTMTDEQNAAITKAIQDIHAVDPMLSDSILQQLEKPGGGLLLEPTDGQPSDLIVTGNQVKATNDYIDGLSKDIESSSQMNMIQLQSLMSSRQTAIQLSTNLISALGESSKAIAANIGR